MKNKLVTELEMFGYKGKELSGETQNDELDDPGEAETGDDTSDQEERGDHSGHALDAWFLVGLWRIHHDQRAEVSTGERQQGDVEDEHPGGGEDWIDNAVVGFSGWVVVAEWEIKQEPDTDGNGDPDLLWAEQSSPVGSQTSEESEEVEVEECGDVHHVVFGDDEVVWLVWRVVTNVHGDAWEQGEGDEEQEEDVGELHFASSKSNSDVFPGGNLFLESILILISL